MHVVLIYIGIFCGIFFEGEMVMITSVIAAHHGHLKLWAVIAIGLAGTYGSDSFYFFLGRKRGKDWLNKNARFRDKYKVIDRKIEKYPILIFLVYRFMYGFRTIAPLAIGVSNTRTSRFLILSAISTLVWGVTYIALGYIFGEVLETKFNHIEHIEKYVIGILLLMGLVVFIVYRIRSKKKRPSSNKLLDFH
jgi:membrane protein DedA with SNARE-associated domain